MKEFEQYKSGEDDEVPHIQYNLRNGGDREIDMEEEWQV